MPFSSLSSRRWRTSTTYAAIPLFLFSSPTLTQVDLITDGRARTVTRIVDNVSWSTEKKLRAAGQWTEWHEQCIELHCVQDEGDSD